jgi:hypothetical protein
MPGCRCLDRPWGVRRRRHPFWQGHPDNPPRGQPRSAASWRPCAGPPRSQAGRTEEATASSELAVFAAPTIKPDVHRTAITSRLTYDAGLDARSRKAAPFRDFVAAFHAVRLALTRWHARPRPHYSVRDGVVDLLLHSSVWSSPVRHCRHPVSVLSEELQIGTATTVSKPVRAQRN